MSKYKKHILVYEEIHDLLREQAFQKKTSILQEADNILRESLNIKGEMNKNDEN